MCYIWTSLLATLSSFLIVSDSVVLIRFSTFAILIMSLSPVSAAREVALADNQVECASGRGNHRIFSSSNNNRAVTWFQLTRSYNKRAGFGRCQATSARVDRFRVSMSLRNWFAISFEVRNELWRVRGVNFSSRNVRKRLQKRGLIAFCQDWPHTIDKLAYDSQETGQWTKLSIVLSRRDNL